MQGFYKTIILFLSFAISFSTFSEYKISDHYDGSKFFNPLQKEKSGLLDFFKWQMTSIKAAWPEKVNLKKSPDLTPILDSTIRITFVNHSTFLIQTKNYNILTDPIWSMRSSPVSFAGPKRVIEPGIPFEKLPKIDAVLVSHNHYDHLDIDTIKMISDRDQAKIFVGLNDKNLLLDYGIKNVTELDWNDHVKLTENIKIHFLKCRHWSARGVFDRFESLWGAYLIEIDSRKIYFAGDTGYAEHFLEAQDKFKNIDLSLLPIGAYEPRWFMRPYHMNPEDALKAASDLKSKFNIGMHMETFQLTDEGYYEPRETLKKLKDSNYPSMNFIVLDMGESWILPEN